MRGISIYELFTAIMLVVSRRMGGLLLLFYLSILFLASYGMQIKTGLILSMEQDILLDVNYVGDIYS